MRAEYQALESDITLEQGIAEYRELNPSLDDARKATPEGTEFFRCHDVAHVIFACDIRCEGIPDQIAIRHGLSIRLGDRGLIHVQRLRDEANRDRRLRWHRRDFDHERIVRRRCERQRDFFVFHRESRCQRQRRHLDRDV